MKGRLNREQRLFFTEQMSLLLLAGVPIVSSLSLLMRSAKKRSLRDFLVFLQQGVESGASISSLLMRYPRSFSSLYVALVEVGEVSGKLPAMFQYLAEIERDRITALKAIRKALIYPLMVMIVAIAVLLFILIAVVPTFESLYQSGGVELPVITQRVLSFSQFLLSEDGLWLVVYLFLSIISVLFLFRRQGRFRYCVDSLSLRIPLIGPLLLVNFNAGFSQILGVLIASGVPLVKGVALYQRALSNFYLKEQLTVLRGSLEKGSGLSQTAKESGIFTDVALTLISVGEVSGTLVKVLDRSGQYHRDIVAQRVDTLVALIDPLSLLFIGGIVGIILVALYLPMFNMGMAI